MGDKFISILDYAVRNLGELKTCSFYGESGGTLELATKDGKTMTIYINIKEEETNA